MFIYDDLKYKYSVNYSVKYPDAFSFARFEIKKLVMP